MDLFSANLDILEKRFPEIAGQLKNHKPSLIVEAFPAKNGQATFYLHQPDAKKILFHSRYDPEKEARDLVLSLALKDVNAVFIQGMGFGYSLKEIRKCFPGIIFVIEPSLDIFQKALENIDFLDLLQDQRVFFITDFLAAKEIINLYCSLQQGGLGKKYFLCSDTYMRFPGLLAEWSDLFQETTCGKPVLPLSNITRHILENVLNIYLNRFRNSGYSDMGSCRSILYITDEFGLHTCTVDLFFEHAFALYAKGDYPQALEVFSIAWLQDSLTGYLKYKDRKLLAEVATRYKKIADSYKEKISPSITMREPKSKNAKVNLAHIIAQFVDDTNSPTKILKSFFEYGNRKIFNHFVYSSENLCTRQAPLYPVGVLGGTSYERAPKLISFLKENNIPFYLAPLDCDYIDSAVALAKRIIADEIDIAFFDSSMFSTIEYMVASWRIIPLQINVYMGTFMLSKDLDAVAYCLPASFNEDSDLWKKNGVQAFLLPEGIELAEKFKEAKEASRFEFGFSQGDILLVTVGNHLDKRVSERFLEFLSTFLLNEKVFWIVVGEGNFSFHKSFLSGKGLISKVKFLGSQINVFPFLKMSDIYLNSFPEGGGISVLEAMAVGLPVLAMQGRGGFLETTGAFHVGEEFSVKDESEYGSFLRQLIGDKLKRKEIGFKMQERFEKDFSPQGMVSAFEGLASELYKKKFLSAVTIK